MLNNAETIILSDLQPSETICFPENATQYSVMAYGKEFQMSVYV